MKDRIDLVAITIFLGTFLPTAIPRARAAEDRVPYRALETGGNVTVESPFGSKLYLGDIGFDRLGAYRLEIPIESLRPPGGGPGGASGSGGNGSGGPGGTNLSATDDDLLIVQANRSYHRGKFDDALLRVDELLRRQPTLARGWLMKGSLMHAMGQPELARKAWQRVRELDPKNTQVDEILKRYPAPEATR